MPRAASSVNRSVSTRGAASALRCSSFMSASSTSLFRMTLALLDHCYQVHAAMSLFIVFLAVQREATLAGCAIARASQKRTSRNCAMSVVPCRCEMRLICVPE
ncbi:hypothetical protein PSAC2689_30086 [Paraburkholderia sacchari]